MTSEDLRIRHLLEILPSVKRVTEYITVRQRGWFPPRRELFAIHYFNRQNEEVAYFMPRMQPEGRLVVFDPLRVWSPESLEEIGLCSQET
jgi:hypothetical protein